MCNVLSLDSRSFSSVIHAASESLLFSKVGSYGMARESLYRSIPSAWQQEKIAQ